MRDEGRQPEERAEGREETVSDGTEGNARRGLTGEVNGKGLDERREDASLNGLVVNDLGLCALRQRGRFSECHRGKRVKQERTGRLPTVVGNGGVAIGELAADAAVADGDGGGAGEDEAGLLDDTGTDVDPVRRREGAQVSTPRRKEGQRTSVHRSVLKLVVLSLVESARVRVDLGELGEEVDVRDLDVVEEGVAIVGHRVLKRWRRSAWGRRGRKGRITTRKAKEGATREKESSAQPALGPRS
jgi:hypothetical protein